MTTPLTPLEPPDFEGYVRVPASAKDTFGRPHWAAGGIFGLRRDRLGWLVLCRATSGYELLKLREDQMGEFLSGLRAEYQGDSA